MTSVVVLATLDTKGVECRFVRDRVRAAGCRTLVMDAGLLGAPAFPADVRREEVAAAAGTTVGDLVALGDRGAAVEAMARGAAAVVAELHHAGELSGVIALGGSGGATIAARAMAALPIGVPKLLVSTVAAGDTRPFVGGTDVMLAYPVVDLAGINRITAQVLSNAAAAIAGMARNGGATAHRGEPDRPAVGLTMFGITTACVDLVRERLAQSGYEPLVFSANGAGGGSLERMARAGELAGVVDVTTTELADELVGGILGSDEPRLAAAGAKGLPQVVSVGALDVVNFGPFATVPERFAGRRLHRHNAAVTLMRTTPQESAELGLRLARRVNAGTGRRTVVLPLRGVSALSGAGAALHDPEADAALFEAVRTELSPDVELVELDAHINDPEVALDLAQRFDVAYRAAHAGVIS
jgi:uncharacterized protein (UPF0261 family)